MIAANFTKSATTGDVLCSRPEPLERPKSKNRCGEPVCPVAVGRARENPQPYSEGNFKCLDLRNVAPFEDVRKYAVDSHQGWNS